MKVGVQEQRLQRRWPGEQTVAGWVLAAVGLLAAGLGWTYGVGTWQRPGPGSMPFVTGLLLTGLAAIWTFTQRTAGRGRRRGKAPGRSVTEDEKPTHGADATDGADEAPPWVAVGKIALAMLLGPLLLSRLGYLLTAFLVCLALMWAMGSRKWWLMLFVSILVSAGCYGVFVSWLKVPLPAGPFA